MPRSEVLQIVLGARLPVASLAHLIALKILSRDDLARPQDAQHLRALLAEASGETSIAHALRSA